MIPDSQAAIIMQLRGEATPPACRRFALTLLGVLPVAGLVWLLVLRWSADRWVWSVPLGFVLAAVLLAGPALAAPGWARWLYVGWHAVTRMIELALTWFLLALVFWLVITPVGLVRRRKSGAFRARPAPRAKSYWQEVPPVKDPSRYYRQF
jgi:hypothetical protein